MKKGLSPVVASTPMPFYCLKVIGGKHVLVGGGGGGAKTGVTNEIRIYSIDADNEVLKGDSPPINHLHTKLTECVVHDTKTLAAMNCDLFDFDSSLGRFLIATGQEDQCHLHTAEYILESVGDNIDAIPKLTFRVNDLRHFQSDFHAKLAFQKNVRFAPFERKFLATGGADGHLRVWSWPALEKTVDVPAHKGDVDSLDISKDDNYIVTVGHDHKSCIWSSRTGDKIMDLPTPTEIPDGYRDRLVCFTSLGSKSHVFVTASIRIERSTKKSHSYLILWVFNSKLASCRPACAKIASEDVISTMSISNDSAYTAVGTLGGDIGVFDTAELCLIKYISKTHGIFVTGVDFLPINPVATQKSEEIGLNYVYPDCKAVVLSISADNTIQLHQIKWDKQMSTTSFVCKTVLLFTVIYFLMKLLGL